MGVLTSSSIFKKLPSVLESGLRGNSEGRTKLGEAGVFSKGRLGFVVEGEGMTVGEASAMVF
jgi:hypothetical protein